MAQNDLVATLTQALADAGRSIAKSLELIAIRMDRPGPTIEKQFDDAELIYLRLAVQYCRDGNIAEDAMERMGKLEQKLGTLIPGGKEFR